VRGVVEGFYGPPWSHTERLSLLGFLAAQGLDTYVYAPKNDIHHRKRWQRPYPPEEMDRFAELFARGEELGVRVFFGLAPARLLGWNNVSRLGDRDGDGIGDSGWDALAAKLRAMQAVGARRFALLFDDTATTFLPALGGGGLGRFHARVGHKAARWLKQEDADAELLLVPAAYAGTWDSLGRGGRAYWRGLSELGDAATVGWTGPKVFSPHIAAADHAELERQTGLRITIWNNGVANDWVHLATGELVGLRGWRKLSFGAVANLDPDLGGAGVLLNGALEPRLFRASTATLATWGKEGAAYDPRTAHADALGHAGPPEALGRLHDLVGRHLLIDPAATEAASLDRALRGGELGEVRDALEAVGELVRQLDSVDPALAAEIAPTLTKVDRLARAGLRALDGHHDDARRLRRDARRIRWLVARRPFARLAREV
jgi:hyaluronoglucosaminidase